MAQTPTEVPEAEAEGKLKSIYEDIKATLRTPFVPHVFRTLAVYPDYLTVAWTALKPNAQIVYFESQADRLRRLAVSEVSSLGRPPVPGDRNASTLGVLQYAFPKVLLATAALRSATNGEQPRMQVLAASEKRQLQRGVPEGASPVAEPDSSADSTRSVLSDMMESYGLVDLTSEFRSVAAQPEYLEAAWATFKQGVMRDQLQRVQRNLRQAVEEAVTSLAFRMDITPHTLRHAGLSEASIDDVRSTLARFYQQTVAETVTVAFLSAAADGQQAGESPFPATTL
jgi:hypothetical protein